MTLAKTLSAVIAAMAITALSANAQTKTTEPATPSQAHLRVPLDIPLLLSGNFGELRINHFHSGLDFKTQGRTGLPVHCAADGYVSRIVVSPWGFGRAVYVTHPELGLVTVYGHLKSFSKKIDRPVRNIQYDTESFRIDTEFPPGKIQVKRGEILGLSGNAGSSGGPHLHLDVRDAATEYALDPMAYYTSSIRDNIAPEVRAIALYPRHGLVDGATRAATRQGKTMKTPFTAWGRVTPGIKAYDRMTGTSNIYGIKYLTLLCDGDTVYHRVIDHIDFNRARAVNTLVEYADVIDSNSWFMITERPDSRPLDDITIKVAGDGTLDINEERDYNLMFIARDHHGNETRSSFIIKGVRATIPESSHNRGIVRYDRDTVIIVDGAKAVIPAGTLYEDNPVSITSEQVPAGYSSKKFRVGDRHIPLSGNYTLTIPVISECHTGKYRYTMVRLDGKRPVAVATSYLSNGKMHADVNRFGDYAVTCDTIAPVITPVTPGKWGIRGRVTYKISDNLSGIETYRGEIDGQWVMFELDGKTGTLSYVLDPERLPARKNHKVVLTVTDEAGNTARHSRTFSKGDK